MKNIFITFCLLLFAGLCFGDDLPQQLIVTLHDVKGYSGPCPKPTHPRNAASAWIDTKNFDGNATYVLTQRNDEFGQYWRYETNDIKVAWSHIKVYGEDGNIVACMSATGLQITVGWTLNGLGHYIWISDPSSSAWYFFNEFYFDENFCGGVINKWMLDDCLHSFWATGYDQWHTAYDGSIVISNPKKCCNHFPNFANFAKEWQFSSMEELALCLSHWLTE